MEGTQQRITTRMWSLANMSPSASVELLTEHAAYPLKHGLHRWSSASIPWEQASPGPLPRRSVPNEPFRFKILKIQLSPQGMPRPATAYLIANSDITTP